MWLELRINFQDNFFPPICDALVPLFLSFILRRSSNDASFPSVLRMGWASHNMVVSGYLHILQWFLTCEERGIEAARPVKLSSSTSAWSFLSYSAEQSNHRVHSDSREQRSRIYLLLAKRQGHIEEGEGLEILWSPSSEYMIAHTCPIAISGLESIKVTVRLRAV